MIDILEDIKYHGISNYWLKYLFAQIVTTKKNLLEKNWNKFSVTINYSLLLPSSKAKLSYVLVDDVQ